MFVLIVLTALLTITASTDNNTFPNGKINGGYPTQIEYHPYQVSIQYLGSHLCEGSLHKRDIVITAANCFRKIVNLRDITVSVGATDKGLAKHVFHIKAIIVHPSYNRTTNVNDIAVINLMERVNITISVRTIQLATSTPKTGTSAIVSGWGSKLEGEHFIDTSQLLNVKVRIIGHEQCSSSRFKHGNSLDGSMFCALENSKKACIGDSGAPLIAESKLIGIFSWKIECYQTVYPGVYTDVSKFQSWIIDTINHF